MAPMTPLANTEPTMESSQTRTPPASEPVLKALTAYRSDPPSIRSIGQSQEQEEEPPPPSSSLLDPIPVMTVKMADLANASSLEHAATVGASVVAKALRAKAVLVHLYDAKTDDIRVLGTDATTAKDTFGVKELGVDDVIAVTVLENKRPLALRFEDAPNALPRRLALLGAERAYLCVPVVIDHIRVALVEVVDADPRFGARVIDACELVADRLVPFVTHREARSA